MKIISVPSKEKGDTGYLKLTDEEIDKIVDLFKQTFQRFIEETKIEEGNIEIGDEVEQIYQQGYNQALKEINQTQAKWLKENF
ncbi:MAG: hypothetical protein ACTSPV_00330 [Candidatus Hodarchaeales archaeon]